MINPFEAAVVFLLQGETDGIFAGQGDMDREEQY